jgi:hypothetical protein
MKFKYIQRSFHNEWIEIDYEGIAYVKDLFNVVDHGNEMTGSFIFAGKEYKVTITGGKGKFEEQSK